MRHRFRACLGCALVLFVALAACLHTRPVMAADEVKLLGVDAAYADTDYGISGTDNPIAQTFTLPQDAGITTVKVGIFAPHGVTNARVVLVDGNVKTGTGTGAELQSTNIAVTNPAKSMVTITYGSPVGLSAGEYTLVVYQTSALAFQYYVAGGTNPYSGGVFIEKADTYWEDYGGNDDLWFEIWGQWSSGNKAPVAVNDSYSVNEDSTLTVDGAGGVLSNDTDDENDPLTAVLVSGTTHGVLSLMADGSFTYTPDANFSGSDSFTYKANDGTSDSDTATVSITVNGVNDPPSFTKGPDDSVNEDSGPRTVAGWATAISAGPQEADQTVSFDVTNDNNDLFEVQPAISSTGTLTYKPAANANGTATVTVKAADDGGTANGGSDTSAPETFTITVFPVNDAPSFKAGADEEVLEDSGQHTVAGWATEISPGPADEADQRLSFIVTNDTNSLFTVQPAIDENGTLTYTLAPDAYGTATVTVRLKDDGGTQNGGVDTSDAQTFRIIVTNVNDAPVITSSAAASVPENTTAVTTVTATDIDSSTLAYSIAGGADADKFGIDEATGVLTFKTAPDYEAPADADKNNEYEVIVQVSDGALTDTQTITVTVTDVNDAPVITSSAAVNVAENTTVVITVTATDDDNDPLAYAIAGGADADKFGIDEATGVLTFKTAPDYEAPTDADRDNVYEVEVEVSDGALTATRTIAVTVTDVNESPWSSPSSGSRPDSNTGSAVEILVNGKTALAGSVSRTVRDGQSVDTVTIDPDKLNAMLEAEGPNAVVAIQLSTKATIMVCVLDGQLVKNMEDMQATLEIRTEQATYTLPARQIHMDASARPFGETINLEDITISVEIAEPTAEWLQTAEDAAREGNFAIVAPLVQFTVKAAYGDEVVEVTGFTSYVERTIAIPDEADPDKITTGVVIEAAGTVRHVPTKIVEADGKYYARINSLTNSLYAVIWHPVEFGDMASHWAKDAANDMGSRMVIDGTGGGKFTPDRDITRAEFAAFLVRGLGLKLTDADTPFADVAPSAWYAGAVNTAHAYQLISGYDDGTFRPNEKITREQAMAMIARAMRITGLADQLAAAEAEDVLSGYTDMAHASKWAIDGIADSVQAGIVTGRDSARLAPQAYISRAEAAAIIQRLLRHSDLI